MHIHILGICVTFMGGLAQIAKALGHEVTGSDQNIRICKKYETML